MKLIVAILLATVASASADVSIIDNDKTRTVDCAKDKEVNLIGNHITITLVGTCAKVMISGNHETVTGSVTAIYISGNHNTAVLDSTDVITVSGNKNTVSWKTSTSKSGAAILNDGKENSITQRK